MSRDRQIEEIGRVLCTHYKTEKCKECNDNEYCMVRMDAEWIYFAGYRKSTDLAEEIFEEIDSLLEGEEKRYENLSDEADDPRFTNEYWEASLTISSIRTILAELKKKYTEEGK